MMHRIYAASYAIYFWSDWLFLSAFAALFVIPFTSFDAGFPAWCVAFAVAFTSLVTSAISEALCRALLRRRRQRRGFSDEEARRIEFLEEQRRVLQVEPEAARLAAERDRQGVEAWWINNRRV